MRLGDGPTQPLALSLSKGGLPCSEPGFDKLSPGGLGDAQTPRAMR
jgi:hypothetical protein